MIEKQYNMNKTIKSLKNVLIKRLEASEQNEKPSKKFIAGVDKVINIIDETVDYTKSEFTFMQLLKLHLHSDTNGELLHWINSFGKKETILKFNWPSNECLGSEHPMMSYLIDGKADLGNFRDGYIEFKYKGNLTKKETDLIVSEYNNWYNSQINN